MCLFNRQTVASQDRNIPTMYCIISKDFSDNFGRARERENPAAAEIEVIAENEQQQLTAELNRKGKTHFQI